MSEDFTRQVLQVATDAEGPIGRFDIADAIEPWDGDPAEGTPEWEAMAARRIAMVRTAAELEQQGFLESVVVGGPGGDKVVISPSGQEFLARL